MPKRRSDELAAIDEVMPLVDQFNSLEHAQRLIFLDMVDPLPEPEPAKKSQKKASKKSSKSSQSATKSERASGMAAQLKERRGQQQRVDSSACAYVLENGKVCNTGDNNPIHDETFGYAGYHPFQPPTTAPPAPVSSPANGALSATERNTRKSAHTLTVESDDEEGRSASLSGVNSETGTDGALNAGNARA